jgi:DNA/RNA-binding domain of Phe-tRNA-synthetase-like protein
MENEGFLVVDRGADDSTCMRMGILIMRGVSAQSPMAAQDVEAALTELRRRYGGLQRTELKALYPVQAYVEYYKKFGYSYHVLGQLESVLSGKKTVGGGLVLLQVMFLAELVGMLLIAGHDLTKVQPPLTLKQADGTESFPTFSGQTAQSVAGDWLVRDGGGRTLSSILRGQDAQSCITADTQDVLYTVYAPANVKPADVEATLRLMQGWIAAFSPSAETDVLRVFE